MNPYERQILNDAEEQVFQTQQEFNEAQETSGIRPPPEIEETESVLEPQLFRLFFGGQPDSEANAFGGGEGGGPLPAGACCLPNGSCVFVPFSNCINQSGRWYGGECSDAPSCEGACCASDGTCTASSSHDCDNSGGVYQGDGTTCDPSPCLPSCGSCGSFPAFDGSGRQFLTRRMTEYTRSGGHCCQNFNQNLDCRITSDFTQTVDVVQTQNQDVECSSTFSPGQLSDTVTHCNGTTTHTTPSIGGWIAPFGFITVISATAESCVFPDSVLCTSCTPGSYSILTSAFYTLEDECAP